MQWNFVLNFLVVLAQSLQISFNESHAAVTQFSNSKKVQQEIGFSDHFTLQGFIDAIDNITRLLGLETDHIVGLNYSLNVMFQEANGMRRDYPKTLVFITDGICSTGVCKTGNETEELILLKDRYRARNIKVVGIGVGSVNRNAILTIVDEENYRHFGSRFGLEFDNFEDLYDPGLPLTLGLCNGMLLIRFRYISSPQNNRLSRFIYQIINIPYNDLQLFS